MQLFRVFGFVLFIASVAYTHGSCTIIPDLSGETDEKLTKRVKSGVAEITLGLGLQTVSSWVPKVSTYPYSKDIESFGPKTVRGMGTALTINGAKDLFFGMKEKYSRSWQNLVDTKKGLLDLSTAAVIYTSSYYMPAFLYDPYIELGGQGAGLILYSFLALRGVKHLTKGLTDSFIDADFSAFYMSSKARALAYFQKPKQS